MVRVLDYKIVGLSSCTKFCKFGLFGKKVASKINFSSTRAISTLSRSHVPFAPWSNCFCLGENQTTPDYLFYCASQSGKLTKRVRQQG